MVVTAMKFFLVLHAPVIGMIHIWNEANAR